MARVLPSDELLFAKRRGGPDNLGPRDGFGKHSIFFMNLDEDHRSNQGEERGFQDCCRDPVLLDGCMHLYRHSLDLCCSRDKGLTRTVHTRVVLMPMVATTRWLRCCCAANRAAESGRSQATSRGRTPCAVVLWLWLVDICSVAWSECGKDSRQSSK